MIFQEMQDLKNLIAIGQTGIVLDKLIEIAKKFPDKDILNSILVISRRWRDNERENIVGAISRDNYNIEKNNINNSLMNIIDWPKLAQTRTDGIISSDNKSTTKINLGKENAWKYSAYIFLSIVILSGIVLMIQYWNFSYANKDESIQLTVYVQDSTGRPIPELQNTGHVKVIFDNDLRFPIIGENGRSNLGEIPEKFKNQDIEVILVANGYELTAPGKKFKMDGKPVYLNATSDKMFRTLQGIVKNRAGDKFISGAMVMIDNDTTIYTDILGRFKAILPQKMQRKSYQIMVKHEGYKVRNEILIPSNSPVEIRLDN